MTLTDATDRRQCNLGHGPVEYREVEFIPLDWLDRAAWWPGLVVYSRPVKVPAFADCRRQTIRREADREDHFRETPVEVIEQLLKETLLPDPSESIEPFQSIDLKCCVDKESGTP